VERGRTKIVCTVGPASADEDTLAAMAAAGADVFRVNGAHASEAEVVAWIERVRRATAGGVRGPAVLVDLPGTKIRLGPLAGEEPLVLAEGQTVEMCPGEGASDGRRLFVPGAHFLAAVPVGRHVLFGEGGARLEVLAVTPHGLRGRVVEGGALRARMGVHFPGVPLPTAVPTRQDRALAAAAIEAGADLLSLSFVRSADDVARLQEFRQERGARAIPVIAKIERLDALGEIDAILRRAEGLMVARGDLGVDAGPERVPGIQHRLLDAARRAGRISIVATEMLESMVVSPRPTRAEAMDVAAAVFMGADAVMLSAETAIGRHPVRVVETMARLLAAAEEDPAAPYAGAGRDVGPDTKPGRPDQHVVRAAVALARETDAEALVVYTRSGMSAVRMSKERPRARIHALSRSEAVCRRLALAWGVEAHLLPGESVSADVGASVAAWLRDVQGLAEGSRAVLVMGSAGDPAGATSVIRLLSL
jgi:pyruvate kinase